jgi:hypothetical protein
MKAATLLLSAGLFLAVPAVATAGTISSGTITGDATSGISSAKTYTHKLDFGPAPAATVNGVAFDSVLAAGAVTPAFTYAVSSGTVNDNPGNGSVGGVPAGEAVRTLLDDMVYNGGNELNGTATLTINGLTPGTQYSARIYSRKWTTTDNARAATIAFDEDGAGPLGTAQAFNQGAADIAQYIEYAYTAVDPSLTIQFTQTTALNQSWHLYGFSNEVVPEPASAAFAALAAGVLATRRSRPRQRR